MQNINVPETVEITVDGWVGFKVVVPNGTSIHLVNQFLGEALHGTVVLINQRRLTRRAPDEKPASVSLLQKLFAVFRR